MSQKQLEFKFDNNDDLMDIPDFSFNLSQRSAPAPAPALPHINKVAEERRNYFGNRATICSYIEPGNTSEDIEQLKQYKSLCYPMVRKCMTFERLSFFEKCMSAEFPWMLNVIKHIRKQCYLRLTLDRPVFYLRPILLVGKPGIGKTRFMRRLGEELGIPLSMLNIAGSTDNRELDGTSRGWSNGDASFPVKFIARKGCPNPIVVLDEIDKESESENNGRMTHTLHQLLETENAKYWRDSYLCTEVDLSHITWLATANRVDLLAPSLLSRFTIIKVRGPEASELFSVAHGAINDFAKSLEIAPDNIPRISAMEWELLENMFKERQPSCRVVVKWVQGLIEQKLEYPEIH